MTLLATKLGDTHHVSVLLRRARALGLAGMDDLFALAVQRGCHHYRAAIAEKEVVDPGTDLLPNEELAMALMLGEHRFDPMALRCATQLLSGDGIDPIRVARLARRERCEQVLAHIARAGVGHDERGAAFWETLLKYLRSPRPVPDGVLPHWSRFVLLTGVHKGVQGLSSTWLRPRR